MHCMASGIPEGFLDLVLLVQLKTGDTHLRNCCSCSFNTKSETFMLVMKRQESTKSLSSITLKQNGSGPIDAANTSYCLTLIKRAV